MSTADSRQIPRIAGANAMHRDDFLVRFVVADDGPVAVSTPMTSSRSPALLPAGRGSLRGAYRYHHLTSFRTPALSPAGGGILRGAYREPQPRKHSRVGTNGLHCSCRADIPVRLSAGEPALSGARYEVTRGVERARHTAAPGVSP